MEATAAAVLKVFVQNLIDASKSQISLIRGLDKDAEKLTITLVTIQEFLNDAEMKTVPDDSVKNWLRKLEDAAFDADTVLDEVNYHHLSKKKNKVLSCFSISNHISRPRKMALRIKEIGENLDSINKEATELGLVGRLANVPALPDAAGFETDSYSVDPIFVGRDGVVSEIVDKILTDKITTDVSILSIVGMGGLGKTTLTRKVFNHEKIDTQFGQSRLWVHVSRDFDPIVVLKKILKKFMRCDEGESREDILKKLKVALKDNVYLLVLDDVWNEIAPKWEDFINSLMGVTSSKGNAIVMTTRSTVVASTVNPFYMHQLESLSKEDCWTIIKEKAFGKGVDAPSDFESIGRKIARRCQGSPLAANIVGGVLKRDKSEENWVSIEKKWLSREDGENITSILRLSFDSLSSASLKKCFAYCSMFPKGYYINKQELIEQWMAEGFLQPDDGSGDMESVGEKYINILLHSSLLQVLERDDGGNVEICSMHDLVHNLARSVLGTSNKADGRSRVRYMSLNNKSSPTDRGEMKYFRTLLIAIGSREISGIMFSHFECLHVLTLRSFLQDFPSSIKKLIHLRKLNISDTGIESLPEWIGEFHYLQSLRADTGYMKKVPSTVKYLTNIRHLYLDRNTVLPTGIGELTCLQTLSYFGVGNENGCKIEELGSLKDLKGKLEICNLERVHDKEGAAKANLFRKSKIMELGLSWGDRREGKIGNDENVLEGLEPHGNLKKLSISNFNGKRFPPWILEMAVRDGVGGSWMVLSKLIEISLSGCPECEEIPMMGHLPNLKTLKLQGLSNVKHINSLMGYGFANRDARIVFPALETLWLDGVPKLARLKSDCGSDVQVLPRLQSLKIDGCQQLMSVGTDSLPCLKYLKIESREGSMSAVSILLQIKYGLLAKLNLFNISDLECMPDVLFNENPNLSELHISRCPKLRELAPGLLTLTSSLKDLLIEDCPLLERITGDDGGEESQSIGSGFFFTSLRIITIKRCDALLWLPCELVGPSLEILYLVRLRSLKNLPSLIDCMARSSRLTEFIVTEVPKFMATGRPVEGWRFGGLRRLVIDASVEGSMETVDGILRGCHHSLTDLRMRGTEYWDGLPESIQCLTAVRNLDLENFGMEELPEWFGNLSSLTILDLRDCKRLRRFPSMDAMARLQGLKSLDISGCPELLAQGVADPEWPKVARICDLYINGTCLVAEPVWRKLVCLI